MRKFVLGLFAAAAVTGAGPLFAQEEADLFTKLDANKDGFVTTDEVGDDNKAKFERQLRNADKDGDKKLSKEEFAASLKPDEAPRQPLGAGGQPGRPGAGAGQFNPRDIFAQLDANKDGKLSKEEAPERMRENFDRLDADGDGTVTIEEFGRAAAAFGGRPQADPRQIDELFSRWDGNSDGKITKDEVPEPRQEAFARILERLSADSLTKEQFVRVAQFLAPPGGPRPDARPGEPRPESRPGEPRPEGRPDARPGEPRPGAPGFRPPVIAALDADGDGELSAGEIEAAAKALLKLDRNGDGKLTPDELGPPRPVDGRPGEGRPSEGRPDARPGARPVEGRPGVAPLGRPMTGEFFRSQDANGDGKLSKEEAPDRLKENFDRLDANKDGQLDETELRRGRDAAGRPEGRPDGERRPEGRRPEGDRPADPKPE